MKFKEKFKVYSIQKAVRFLVRQVYLEIRKIFIVDPTRKSQTKIRRNKTRISRLEKDNENLRRKIRRQRLENEYYIRGIIGNYYSYYINVLNDLQNELFALYHHEYSNLKIIGINIKKNYHGNKQRYYEINSELHKEIGNSKALTKQINELRKELIDRQNRLLDKDHPEYNHRKLGGKKLLKEIIQDEKNNLLSEYGKRNELELDDFVFELNKKCSGCGSHISPLMNYCFVCGKNNIEAYFDPKLKKNSKALLCEKCYFPIIDNWFYCPNCKNELDTFNLRSMLKLKSR